MPDNFDHFYKGINTTRLELIWQLIQKFQLEDNIDLLRIADGFEIGYKLGIEVSQQEYAVKLSKQFQKMSEEILKFN